MSTSPKGKNGSGTKLITQCIKTAGEFAIINVLYAADPSDDDFCQRMADRHLMSARQSTARLAQVEATSLLAFRQKLAWRAAIDDEAGMMEKSIAAFLRSFIAETIELIDPLVREQRFADEKAAREASDDLITESSAAGADDRKAA